MYVRLANDWTGPDQTRHRAGELVEVDNVTLAELEAGGFVSTEEESRREADKKGPDADGRPEAPQEPADAREEKDPPEDGGDGADPDSASWPPIS